MESACFRKNFLFNLLVFALSSNFLLYSQNPDHKWANKIGGANYDEGKGIAKDNFGNVYITGYFESTCDFDPGPGVATLTVAGVTETAFIAKYDQNGNYIWAKALDGPNYESRGNDIEVDAAGNVIIIGEFQGTVDFDPSPSTATIITVNWQDGFVAKYTSNGVYTWAFRIGSPTTDKSYELTTDQSGNVFVSGEYGLNCDFDPSAAIATLTTTGTFFAKYDPNGNYLWAKKLGNAAPKDLEIDLNGHLVMAGYFNLTVDFDPGIDTVDITSNSGSVDIFIAKYNQNGDYLFAGRIGAAGSDFCYGMDLDNNGNIYLTGKLGGIVDFDPGPLIVNVGTFNVNNLYVAKFAINGTLIWVDVINTAWSDYSYPLGIAVDNSGAPIIIGRLDIGLDFDPGPNYATLSSSGNYDFFFAKYSTTGVYLWSKGIGGSLDDIAQDIEVDNCGNPLITGYFSTNVDFDAGPATNTLSSAGSYDIFFMKYSNITASSNYNSLCTGQSATLYASGAGSGGTYTWNPGNIISPSIVVTPTSTTIFTVTGTSTLGCINSSTLQINAYQVPGPTITVNSGSICSGNSFTINPSGANSYTIQGGNAVVSPTINTNYSIIGSNTVGCLSQTPAICSVTVSNLPLPTITVNSGSVCIGSSFTLNPSGAQTYTFSSTTAIVSPSVNTSYTVIGTNSLGCTNTISAVANISVNPVPTITASNGTICEGQSFTINPSGAMSYTYSSSSAIVSPSISTTYSIYGTNGYGCDNLIPTVVTVSVNSAPIILVNSGTICAGESFTMNPTGATSYTYSSSIPIVGPVSTTTYTIDGIDINGCVSLSSAICTVVVNPLPVLSVLTNSTFICPGQPVILTASGANTYTWSPQGSNSYSVVISPTITTTYTVSGTGTNNCTTSNPYTQNVIACTSLIDANRNNQQFDFFPNPVHDYLTIRFKENSGGLIQIKLINFLGMVLLEESKPFSDLILDLQHLPKGIYYLIIENSKDQSKLKVIKN